MLAFFFSYLLHHFAFHYFTYMSLFTAFFFVVSHSYFVLCVRCAVLCGRAAYRRKQLSTCLCFSQSALS